MTRRTRGGVCVVVWAPAESDASAMPPRPVAIRPRKSRRLFDASIDIEELVAVEEHVAGVGQAMPLDIGGECDDFALRRRALEHEAEGSGGLVRGFLCFTGDAGGDVLALPDQEGVV